MRADGVVITDMLKRVLIIGVICRKNVIQNSVQNNKADTGQMYNLIQEYYSLWFDVRIRGIQAMAVAKNIYAIG